MVDNDCNGRVDDVMAHERRHRRQLRRLRRRLPAAGQRRRRLRGGRLRGQVRRPASSTWTATPATAASARSATAASRSATAWTTTATAGSTTASPRRCTAARRAPATSGSAPRASASAAAASWSSERPPACPRNEVCDGLDNDCNGKVDELFDLQTDARNCGACGITCATGVKCERGALRRRQRARPCPCPRRPRRQRRSGADRHLPAGRRAAPPASTCRATPPTAAAAATSAPPACSAGWGPASRSDKLPAGTAPPPVIRPSCPLPPPPTGGGADGGVGGCPAEMPDACKGPAGDLYCTNLRFDNASCGACGVPCPAGAFCRDGRCESGSTEPGGTVPTPPAASRSSSAPIRSAAPTAPT